MIEESTTNANQRPIWMLLHVILDLTECLLINNNLGVIISTEIRHLPSTNAHLMESSQNLSACVVLELLARLDEVAAVRYRYWDLLACVARPDAQARVPRFAVYSEKVQVRL